MDLKDPMVQFAEIIRRGRQAADSSYVRELLDEALEWKASGYDTQQARRRDHYEGRSATWVRQRLMQLFPESGAGIPVLPFGWIKMAASIQASVYDWPAVRELLGDDDQPLPPEDERVLRFASVLRDAAVDRVMPEAERRVACARTIVVAVRWRERHDAIAGAIVGRCSLDLYWPSDVWIVPHESAPSDPSMAVALLARSAHGGHEVWRREADVDPATGRVRAFGPWIVGFFDDEGKESRPEVEYKGRILPFCLLRIEDSGASPWVATGDDDIHLAEAQAVDQSDALYLGLKQAHSDRVYRGNHLDRVEGGPDRVIKIDPNENLDTLDYNPKIIERSEALQSRLRMWALSRRISQDAVSVEPSAPLSGVSRQIANEPQDKMRRESEAALKDFEEQQLLPVLVDVHDTFTTGKEIGVYRFRMTPAQRPAYEDPEARQRRALEARDAGQISAARAAVECGWYGDLASAVAAGLSDEIEPRGNSFLDAIAPGGSNARTISDDNGDDDADGV